MRITDTDTNKRRLGQEMPTQGRFELMAPRYRKTELAYFAGFFEADGNVAIILNEHSGQFTLRVSVTQKDPSILHHYEDTFGGSIDNRSGQWYATSTTAVGFLRAVSPYLRFKGEEAAIALEFQSLVRGRTNTPIPSSLREKQARLFRAIRIAAKQRGK